MYNVLAIQTFLYGSETWTIKSEGKFIHNHIP